MAPNSAKKRFGEIEQRAAAVGSPTVGQRRTGRAAKGVRCRRRIAAVNINKRYIPSLSVSSSIFVGRPFRRAAPSGKKKVPRFAEALRDAWEPRGP